MKQLAHWGADPPSFARGKTWCDLSRSADTPSLRVANGGGVWSLAGDLATTSLSFVAAPGVRVVASAGVIPLASFPEGVIVVSGSVAIGDLGPSTVGLVKTLVFSDAGGTLVSGFAAPRGAALILRVGDTLTIADDGRGGWRMLAWTEPGLFTDLLIHVIAGSISAAASLGVTTRRTWQGPGSLAAAGGLGVITRNKVAGSGGIAAAGNLGAEATSTH
jgi:hypothetical protein